MFKIVIISLFVIISCNNANNSLKHKPVMKNKYYKDINIYKLEGINEMSEISYPCIEIGQSNEKKIITYHINKERNSTDEYTHIDGGGWLSRSESKGDTTAMIYIYQFILPNKVLQFNYSDKNSYKILDASVISDNKETIYFPEKSLIVEPKIQNFDTIEAKAESIYVNEIIIKNSILTEISKKTDKKGELIHSHFKCFETKNHYSYIWWTYFGFYLKETECK